jgi:hypothetical protein
MCPHYRGFLLPSLTTNLVGTLAIAINAHPSSPYPSLLPGLKQNLRLKTWQCDKDMLLPALQLWDVKIHQKR